MGMCSRRAVVQFPTTDQGKERARRAEEIVMPELEQYKPIVSKRVFEEMKSAGIRGDKKYLQDYHKDKCVHIVRRRTDRRRSTALTSDS